MNKPPLGLIPRKYIDTQRWHEINAAISRYMEAGKEIPAEWIEERAEIELRSSGHSPQQTINSTLNIHVSNEQDTVYVAEAVGKQLRQVLEYTMRRIGGDTA